jgi:hypothetical protein
MFEHRTTTMDDALARLEAGTLHSFASGRLTALPARSAGAYTIWQDRTLVYAGVESKDLAGRLASHASGRRSGDQFCVYVADRFVLALITAEQRARIVGGELGLDQLVRAYIQERLGFRFVVLPDGQSARQVEQAVRRGALRSGKPLLNPLAG